MSAADPLIITLADARAIGGHGVHCAPGIRAWFARYGLDYRAFVREGIPAQVLLATGDAFALRVVQIARARRAGDTA